MGRALCILLLAGCDLSFAVSTTSDDSPPPDDAMTPDELPIDGAPGSARKKRITIPEGKVFGNLTSFPVWLVFDDAGLAAKATTAGNDIFFTGTDGTPLEWERVAWSKPTGHLEAWVRMPLLSDATGGELDLRYGDPGPAHAPNAAQTFSNAFLAVWHLEDPLGGNTIVADARALAPGIALNGPTSVAGRLGKAFDFDGTNDEVSFNNPLSGGGSSTISAWVSIAQPVQGYSSVMTVGNPSINQSRFLHTKHSTGLASGFFGNDNITTVDIHNSQFTLLHWIYDSTTDTTAIYRDGVEVSSATVVGNPGTTGTGGHIGTAPVQWGPGGNQASPLNGVLDEVRIANVARAPGWVRTEFANQSDVSTFFTLGPEMQAP